jgi:hypothetical protein
MNKLLVAIFDSGHGARAGLRARCNACACKALNAQRRKVGEGALERVEQRIERRPDSIHVRNARLGKAWAMFKEARAV